MFLFLTLEKSTYLKLSPDLFIQMKREDIFSQYSIGKALGEGTIKLDFLRCLWLSVISN